MIKQTVLAETELGGERYKGEAQCSISGRQENTGYTAIKLVTIIYSIPYRLSSISLKWGIKWPENWILVVFFEIQN